MCLCNDPIGIVDIDVDDCVSDEAFKFEGNKGLHGEWDPAAAAEAEDEDDDAAIGIPDAVYKSWLNWKKSRKKIRNKSVSFGDRIV